MFAFPQRTRLQQTAGHRRDHRRRGLPRRSTPRPSSGSAQRRAFRLRRVLPNGNPWDMRYEPWHSRHQRCRSRVNRPSANEPGTSLARSASKEHASPGIRTGHPARRRGVRVGRPGSCHGCRTSLARRRRPAVSGRPDRADRRAGHRYERRRLRALADSAGRHQPRVQPGEHRPCTAAGPRRSRHRDRRSDRQSVRPARGPRRSPGLERHRPGHRGEPVARGHGDHRRPDLAGRHHAPRPGLDRPAGLRTRRRHRDARSERRRPRAAAR